MNSIYRNEDLYIACKRSMHRLGTRQHSHLSQGWMSLSRSLFSAAAASLPRCTNVTGCWDRVMPDASARERKTCNDDCKKEEGSMKPGHHPSAFNRLSYSLINPILPLYLHIFRFLYCLYTTQNNINNPLV